jgi:hypothetical protein
MLQILLRSKAPLSPSYDNRWAMMHAPIAFVEFVFLIFEICLQFRA